MVVTSVVTIINKHTDYTASGKSVLNTQRSDEYGELDDEYGIEYNNNDSSELTEALDR